MAGFFLVCGAEIPPHGHRDMKSLLIIGCGGHGRIVAEAARDFRVVGFADDDPHKVGTTVDGWTVLGAWPDVAADTCVVAIGNNAARRAVFEKLMLARRATAVVIAPGAMVSRRAKVGPGSVILSGCVVQAGAVIGANVLLNAGALVDHDAVVDDHAHVGLNSVVSSFARVGNGEWLPSGAVRARN